MDYRYLPHGSQQLPKCRMWTSVWRTTVNLTVTLLFILKKNAYWHFSELQHIIICQVKLLKLYPSFLASSAGSPHNKSDYRSVPTLTLSCAVCTVALVLVGSPPGTPVSSLLQKLVNWFHKCLSAMRCRLVHSHLSGETVKNVYKSLSFGVKSVKSPTRRHRRMMSAS